MRLSNLDFSRCRTGLLAAGAVFAVAVAAPVQVPVPGDLSFVNAAEAQSRRASRASQQESGCDATCLNNQQLQAIQAGGMSGGGAGMSSGGGMSSGAGMSGGSMSTGPRTGSGYRGGTGGQPRTEAEAAEKGARTTR